MSNSFSGNFPPSNKDDRKDSLSTPARPAFESSLNAPPRPPLFPRKDDDKTETPRPLFPRPAVPAPDVKAPLFPRREETSAPLFPPREPKAAPLFPPRTPMPAPVPGVPSAPTAPTFGAPAPGAATPPRPLFPPRPATQAPGTPGSFTSPVAGTSAFAPRQAATDAPKPPLFPRRETAPAAPAGTYAPAAPRPQFGAAPAAPKPLFGAAPAGPATPRPLFGASPSSPAATSGMGQVGSRKDAKLTDDEFIQLRDFLYAQSGIYVAENRKYLVENRLSSRLRELGLRSFGEYYNYLRYDANRSTEMNKLYENMTTNETSFFRNGPQLDVFRDKVLIKVLDELRAKGQKKLRIWSAGCSSGEEPYTLAMILYEVLKQETSSWDIKITANDLSLAMLAAARRGVYNDYAIRTTPPDMLNRYFTKEGNFYRIDPKLQKLISFGQINLSDKAQLQKVEKSQIVFCRNVIIYFDDEMKKSVINAFYDNLLPGGYLLIGHSESLHNISRAFKPEHYAGSIVYCKQS